MLRIATRGDVRHHVRRVCALHSAATQHSLHVRSYVLGAHVRIANARARQFTGYRSAPFATRSFCSTSLEDLQSYAAEGDAYESPRVKMAEKTQQQAVNRTIPPNSKPLVQKWKYVPNHKQMYCDEQLLFVPGQTDTEGHTYASFRFPWEGKDVLPDEHGEWKRGEHGLCFREWFGNDHPVHLDIGCGNGEWVAQKAFEHPEVNWVAIDHKWVRCLNALRHFYALARDDFMKQLQNLESARLQSAGAVKTAFPDVPDVRFADVSNLFCTYIPAGKAAKMAETRRWLNNCEYYTSQHKMMLEDPIAPTLFDLADDGDDELDGDGNESDSGEESGEEEMPAELEQQIEAVQRKYEQQYARIVHDYSMTQGKLSQADLDRFQETLREQAEKEQKDIMTQYMQQQAADGDDISSDPSSGTTDDDIKKEGERLFEELTRPFDEGYEDWNKLELGYKLLLDSVYDVNMPSEKELLKICQDQYAKARAQRQGSSGKKQRGVAREKELRQMQKLFPGWIEKVVYTPDGISHQYRTAVENRHSMRNTALFECTGRPNNLRVIKSDINFLFQHFMLPGSVDSVSLNFPEPKKSPRAIRKRRKILSKRLKRIGKDLVSPVSASGHGSDKRGKYQRESVAKKLLDDDSVLMKQVLPLLGTDFAQHLSSLLKPHTGRLHVVSDDKDLFRFMLRALRHRSVRKWLEPVLPFPHMWTNRLPDGYGLTAYGLMHQERGADYMYSAFSRTGQLFPTAEQDTAGASSVLPRLHGQSRALALEQQYAVEEEEKARQAVLDGAAGLLGGDPEIHAILRDGLASGQAQIHYTRSPSALDAMPVPPSRTQRMPSWHTFTEDDNADNPNEWGMVQDEVSGEPRPLKRGEMDGMISEAQEHDHMVQLQEKAEAEASEGSRWEEVRASIVGEAADNTAPDTRGAAERLAAQCMVEGDNGEITFDFDLLDEDALDDDTVEELMNNLGMSTEMLNSLLAAQQGGSQIKAPTAPKKHKSGDKKEDDWSTFVVQ